MRGVSDAPPAAAPFAAMPPAEAPPAAAPAAPAGAPRARGAADEALEPPYHLVLLDDDHHSYAYVIEMLGKLFGYGRAKAFALARIVDGTGRAVVETADRERVTRDQRRIHSYGPDPRIPASKGSMSAVVERADAP